MITPAMFVYGENSTQYYYVLENQVLGELIHAIRNKKENHWWGIYDRKQKGTDDVFFLIPIDVDPNHEVVIERICEWYANGKERAKYREAPEPPKSTKLTDTMKEITNMFGEFPEKAALRIQAYLNDPSVERWDDISGIIINGKDTLWQLLCEADPTFPKVGKTTNIKGEIVEEWAKIPSPMEVLRVIKQAVK